MGITNDPNTPFASARRVAHLFGNAVLLAQQGYGHGTYSDPSACVDAAMGKYLADLVTPPRGTICRSDRQPFDPHFGEPPARTRFHRQSSVDLPADASPRGSEI
jgi:hypothetical protein